MRIKRGLGAAAVVCVASLAVPNSAFAISGNISCASGYGARTAGVSSSSTTHNHWLEGSGWFSTPPTSSSGVRWENPGLIRGL